MLQIQAEQNKTGQEFSYKTGAEFKNVNEQKNFPKQKMLEMVTSMKQ